MRAPGERVLPILAGVLLALAYPPARLLAPAFVGLVPLLVLIAERPAGAQGRWSATKAGALTGVIYYGALLYWIVIALLPESALAVPAYVLSVFMLAGFTAAFGWALHYTLERLRLPLPLLAALLWTALEWTQGQLGHLAYPWLGLGYALAPFPRLAGAADLVGVRGLTLWIVAVNGLIAMAVLHHRAAADRPGRWLAAAALVVAIPAAYGLWRAATLELRPVARVAVVQPNIAQEIKRDHALALDLSMIVLTRLTRRLAGDNGSSGQTVQLVAWPEVAITADLAGDPDLMETVQGLSRFVDAPVLAGAFGVDGLTPGEPRSRRYNSAFLVTGDGPTGERYDKRRLVAFVETTPFRSSGLSSGRAGPLFQTGTPAARFGVLICYESAFGYLARRYRRDGAEFLVNITNDGWFGREPWYARTTALWQHPAHMTMRAIETRMGVARAANTGFSMFIDPVGRVRHATTLFTDDVLVDDVLTTGVTTLFVRLGDWLAILATLAAAALLLAARFHHPALSAGNVGPRPPPAPHPPDMSPPARSNSPR